MEGKDVDVSPRSEPLDPLGLLTPMLSAFISFSSVSICSSDIRRASTFPKEEVFCVSRDESQSFPLSRSYTPLARVLISAPHRRSPQGPLPVRT